jgi:hypothetical protein
VELPCGEKQFYEGGIVRVEDLNGDTEFYEDEWDTESAPASP